MTNMAEMFQVISLLAGVIVVFAALGHVNRRADRATAKNRATSEGR
jgi:uncharacterized membrane protein